MIIKVVVALNGVLDPQGKAIQQTLNGMNFNNVDDVRQGKFFEINVNENDEAKAKLQVEDMCKTLANLVIEDYKILNEVLSHDFSRSNWTEIWFGDLESLVLNQ